METATSVKPVPPSAGRHTGQTAGQQALDHPDSDDHLKLMVRIGGVAALLAALLFRRNLAAELVMVTGIHAPETAADWFALFQRDHAGRLAGFSLLDAYDVLLYALIGLMTAAVIFAVRRWQTRPLPLTLTFTAAGVILSFAWFGFIQDNHLTALAYFNLFDLVNYGLVGLMFAALYLVLRPVREGLMKLATGMGLIGIGVYFASSQAFAMLNLVDRSAGATTGAQQAVYLAAGEALLAMDNPGAITKGTGMYAGLLLVTLAGLLIAVVMRQSGLFSRFNAWMGILANGLLLLYFPLLIFAPGLVVLPFVTAALPMVLWQAMIALRLLQFARYADPHPESRS